MLEEIKRVLKEEIKLLEDAISHNSSEYLLGMLQQTKIILEVIETFKEINHGHN